MQTYADLSLTLKKVSQRARADYLRRALAEAPTLAEAAHRAGMARCNFRAEYRRVVGEDDLYRSKRAPDETWRKKADSE